MIKHIPNSITLLNLVSGFAATIYAIKGYNEYASFCIMAGMVLDFSDGFAARLLKAYSAIGKDLDSLADVVTFGIAPGAIIMNMLMSSGLQFVPAFVIAAIIPVASALRLAKFNNDTTQSTSFRGLATPGSAFIVVSVVIASVYTDYRIFDTLAGSMWFTGLMSLFLAVMMLINMRMFSLKLSSLRWRDNEERWLFASVSVLLFIIFRLASLPMIMAAYIVISVVFNLLRRRETSSGNV